VTDRIERELHLPARPERVWQALTDPEQVAHWLADEVTLELWPGGEATFRIGDTVYAGWVEEVRPPAAAGAPAPAPDGSRAPEEARLTYWWAADGQAASRVEIVISPSGEGATRLRIVETRPLEVLDLVGIPLPGRGGARFGPALVAA
jgi:uncharacterized protein YndB with AHSA1/START domain